MGRSPKAEELLSLLLSESFYLCLGHDPIIIHA